MAQLRFMTDYHTTFHTKSYLHALFGKDVLAYKGFVEFRLKTLHTLWSNLKPKRLSESHGDEVRCLEYGGGPSIVNLISATPKVDRILFAEYTEANRQAVVSWIAGRPDAHDWSPWVEFVVRDLEEDESATAVFDRQEHLKRKIQSIVPCDATKDPMVDLESVDVGKLFDVISTSLCLETCVTSEEEYRRTVSRLCKFLKPGGYLYMFGVLREEFYPVGDEKFRTFPLTQSMVESAMRDAGIEGIKINVFEIGNELVKKSFFNVVGMMTGEV